jgi:hypothetical protein
MTARQIMKSFALDICAALAGVAIIGVPMLMVSVMTV